MRSITELLIGKEAYHKREKEKEEAEIFRRMLVDRSQAGIEKSQ